MWTYALTAPRRFGKFDVPAPSPDDLQPGQVLLRPLAGAICGSDLPSFAGYGGQRPRYTGGHAPSQPGFPMHEVLGEVVASAHPHCAAGMRVVGWAVGADAMSEFVVTSGDSLAQVDDSLDPAVAILTQTLACVLFAADRIGDVEGESVAVLGLGPIGMLFAHVLKLRGARRVTGVDLVDRSDVAADFGIDEAVHSSCDQWADRIADADRPGLLVEAIGHQHTSLADAMNAVAVNGRIFYFGIPSAQPVSFDLQKFLRKSLQLQSGATPVRHRHDALAAAGKHLQEHPFLAEKYVTHVFGVADVQDAYDLASVAAPGRLKVAVRMS